MGDRDLVIPHVQLAWYFCFSFLLTKSDLSFVPHSLYLSLHPLPPLLPMAPNTTTTTACTHGASDMKGLMGAAPLASIFHEDRQLVAVVADDGLQFSPLVALVSVRR